MYMIKNDIVIIGSGIAGLNFALNASSYADIIIITKDTLKNSNTFYAQGGLAAVFSDKDSFEEHINDTLKVGEGLSDKKVVEYVIKNAPNEIKKLSKLGVSFNKSNSNFALSREAAHSKPRIVHAADATGREIEETLCSQIKSKKNIKIFESCLGFELIIKNKKCHGVYALDRKKNKVLAFISKAVILATGGIGQLYKYTTNPSIATGDGIAMAYNAGAKLSDLEFIQFHPTMFAKKRFLISETLRGEGGILKNVYGERFMQRYSKDKELAPRNIVARACFLEMKMASSDFVYLDISNKEPTYIRKRFPNIYKVCKQNGIDMTKEPLPVLPAAHYICGGILTNLNSETNIKGLYAIGEAACTKLHGADRLASNSLTEALVFSSRAGNIVKKYINQKNFPLEKNFFYKRKNNFCVNIIPNSKFQNLKSELKEIMWNNVGIIRSIDSLNNGIKKIISIKNEIDKIIKKGINKEILELNNMAITALLITKSALKRKESRGCHFLMDYPEKKKDYERHIITFFK